MYASACICVLNQISRARSLCLSACLFVSVSLSVPCFRSLSLIFGVRCYQVVYRDAPVMVQQPVIPRASPPPSMRMVGLGLALERHKYVPVVHEMYLGFLHSMPVLPVPALVYIVSVSVRLYPPIMLVPCKFLNLP